VKGDFPDLVISMDKDLQVLCDQRLIYSILRNLIHNSVQHGKATQVFIKSHQQQGSNLEISITDNGTGTDKLELLGKSPIEDGSSDGSGIGLFLAHRLMRLQKGNLHFSQTPQGLTAHLILPNEQQVAK
jgi:signal transduction histidine kinase